MRDLSWVQCKEVDTLSLMRCVHTHQGKPIIERCGSLSHVGNIVENIGDDS